MCSSDLRILGVRYSSSLLFESVTVGVLRVVLTGVGVIFCSIGVEVLFFEPGELRNCDGENGNDLIGVQVFGLLNMLSERSWGTTKDVLTVESLSSGVYNTQQSYTT